MRELLHRSVWRECWDSEGCGEEGPAVGWMWAWPTFFCSPPPEWSPGQNQLSSHLKSLPVSVCVPHTQQCCGAAGPPQMEATMAVFSKPAVLSDQSSLLLRSTPRNLNDSTFSAFKPWTLNLEGFSSYPGCFTNKILLSVEEQNRS